MSTREHGGSTDRARPGVGPARTVFRWWDYPVFVALSGLSLSAMAYFVSYWFSLGDWREHPFSFLILTAALLVILLNNQARWFLLPLMRKPGPAHPPSGLKAAVVTTFVPGAESLEMLSQSVRALVALDYPHETWVLDEGDGDEVKALCRELGAYHFSRRDLLRYQTDSGEFQARSKHGNYNAWLHEIGFERYDTVTGFDPDHVPVPEFLSRVLGYFDDPDVAYVQTAQAYYNQPASFVARGAAEETYDFYSSMAMIAYGLGHATLVGAHNTQRVGALKAIGGYPAHDAEDLLLAVRYRSHGWRGVYLPEILARGLTPVDWQTYLQQQRRWARALLDVRWRITLGTPGRRSLAMRVVSLVEGLNYLRRSLLIPVGLMLLAAMLAGGTVPAVVSSSTVPRLAFLVAVLQVCELYRQRFYLHWRAERGVHWRAGLLQLAKWPYVLAAVWDVLTMRRVGYVITPKVAGPRGASVLCRTHLPVVIVICAAWVIGVTSGRSPNGVLQGCACVAVAATLALMATERMKFPLPYDRRPGSPRAGSPSGATSAGRS